MNRRAQIIIPAYLYDTFPYIMPTQSFFDKFYVYVGPPHPTLGWGDQNGGFSINVWLLHNSFLLTSAFNPISQRGCQFDENLTTNSTLISIIGGGNERRGEERGGGVGDSFEWNVSSTFLNYQRALSYLAWPAHYFFLMSKMKNILTGVLLGELNVRRYPGLSPLPTDVNFNSPAPFTAPPPFHPCLNLRFI